MPRRQNPGAFPGAGSTPVRCSVNKRTLAIAGRTRTHPPLPECLRYSSLGENECSLSWSSACIPISVYRKRRFNVDDLFSGGTSRRDVNDGYAALRGGSLTRIVVISF
jgi:hypothetical protein